MQQDRHEEAKEVIAALRDAPIDDPEVMRLALDIQTAILEESKGGPFKIKELFTGGKMANWRRTTLTIAVELMQQFTGANMMSVTSHHKSCVDANALAETTTHPSCTQPP